jgi:acetoin utilization deacetylase AcuC-like enzyme
VEVFGFAPVDERTLSQVHAPSYVRNVLTLQQPNGFGSTSQAVADSLLWTTGSFVAAALHAWSTRLVACSPTSGFHHACFASGGGFCTFNGLMVAAHRLLAEGVRLVGVLDCDEHYGNGTDDILATVKALKGRVRHFTRGSPGYGDDPETFLATLAPLLTEWKAEGVDIVLYQAGADPHVDDPLGGFLTSQQLAERDRIVFTTCRRLGLPIVWNLAGGYQERPSAAWPERIRPVLDIHDATMRECVRAFDPNL